MVLCFLLLSVLFPGPGPPQDLDLDQSHFSCRLCRRPQYAHGSHTLWMQVFMGCTYGVVQEMPKTYIMHKGRRDVWKHGPLQIICTVKGHRSVITEANLDINPHLGDRFWSVMGELRVDQQKSVVFKRNMALPIKNTFGVKEKKQPTNLLQFKKVRVGKKFYKQEFPLIQSKDPFHKKKIHSVAMNKNLIKIFVPRTQRETKMKVTERMLNKYKTAITQMQAKKLNDPYQKIQTTKTMFVIEKTASKQEGIKAKSLQSIKIHKGRAFHSMREVSKAFKIRQLPKLSNITPTVATTSTASQKIKSAAANPEMQPAVITEDFNGEWDSQSNISTKTELETDSDLRFVTKKQTVKPQSTSQMLGLRMREESPDEKTAEEEKKVEDGDNPLCKGLIHQTEAGLMHCKDRLEKFNRKAMHGRLGKESESFHTGESDGADYDHFYYFDGVLKRVKNNPLNQRS